MVSRHVWKTSIDRDANPLAHAPHPLTYWCLPPMPSFTVFHKKCITPWLMERARSCPICKRDPVSTERTQLISAAADMNSSEGELPSEGGLPQPPTVDVDTEAALSINVSINGSTDDDRAPLVTACADDEAV